jgi:hypothetical protein
MHVIPSKLPALSGLSDTHNNYYVHLHITSYTKYTTHCYLPEPESDPESKFKSESNNDQ